MGLWRFLIRVWDTTQIELKGEYSPDRVLALNDYTNSTSWRRIIVLILLTPLPCLIYICLPETVNLSPPSLGIASNKTFFARLFLSCSMWCLLQLHMISSRMPLLPLSNRQLVVSAVTVAALSTGVVLFYAWWIGFPVPYTIQLLAAPYVSLMFFALAIVCYPHVRQNWGLLWKIADAILICVCHGIAIIEYPLFYYAFQKMEPGIESTAFSMMLPILKMFFRVLFYYFCRSASGERITIVVVFNADLVNALFVNFCMQYQPSLLTTVSLMAANALQVILMTRDIDVIRRRIAETTDEIIQLRKTDKYGSKLPGDRVLTFSMLPRAADIFSRYNFDTTKSGVIQTQLLVKKSVDWSQPRKQSKTVPVCDLSAQAASRTSSMVETLSELEILERQYAVLVRKLMYASEFSILTAYAELITPIVYSLYLFIVFHMPNREYYSQISSMDSGHLVKTVLNVLLYSLVELGSFIGLTQTLKRRLNFSTIHQLAFVLDREMIQVQTALILWVFYSTQTSLEHYGSFKT
ncbi:hypothetical protein DVH05_009623 [Phytophthora capsici]|nr:hypothetical protein DVH05_009623 [Phytophthora capsici]